MRKLSLGAILGVTPGNGRVGSRIKELVSTQILEAFLLKRRNSWSSLSFGAGGIGVIPVRIFANLHMTSPADEISTFEVTVVCSCMLMTTRSRAKADPQATLLSLWRL